MNTYNEKLLKEGRARAKAYTKEMRKLGMNIPQFAKYKGISHQRMRVILAKLS